MQFRIEAADLKLRIGRDHEALAGFESLLAGLNPESWLYREVRRRIEEVFLKGDDPSGLAPGPYHVLARFGDRWVVTNFPVHGAR